MNTKEFTNYCLNVCPDNSFEDDFKFLYYRHQVEFVLYMVDIFRTWTKEDFQKFKERNVVDIIFGNLTMDSSDLFMRILSMDYKHREQTCNWSMVFCLLFKNVKGLGLELGKYMIEKDDFNEHQIAKNRN